MKKIIIITLSSLIFLIVFTLLYNYFPFIKSKPDIILIIVVYLAITSDSATDIILAFILGYLFDIFSGNPVGFFTMLRTVTFAITRVFNMRFFSKTASFFMIITFIIGLFDSVYLGYQFNTAGYGFLHIFGEAVYLSFINAVTALLMYPLLLKVEELYLKTREELEGRY